MPIGQRAISQRVMREDWGTPDAVFAPLDAEFHFTVDAAATIENAKAPLRFTDGLAADWSGATVWLNPPYGHKNLWTWIGKAYRESQRGATVVCLVPSHRVDPMLFWAWIARYRLHIEEFNRRPTLASVLASIRPLPEGEG